MFTFIGSSVIYLSLSEIPMWTHQRQLGLIYNIFTSLSPLPPLAAVKVGSNHHG